MCAWVHPSVDVGVLVFRLLARHFCGIVSASDQPGPL